jgi:hypothetical protein
MRIDFLLRLGYLYAIGRYGVGSNVYRGLGGQSWKPNFWSVGLLGKDFNVHVSLKVNIVNQFFNVFIYGANI